MSLVLCDLLATCYVIVLHINYIQNLTGYFSMWLLKVYIAVPYAVKSCNLGLLLVAIIASISNFSCLLSLKFVLLVGPSTQ